MQNLSIKNKIFFLFFSVLFVSISLVGYLGYSNAQESYINKALELSKNKTEQLSITIEEHLSSIPIVNNYFSNFYALQRYFIWKSIGEKNKEKEWEDKFSNALLDFMIKRKIFYKFIVLNNDGLEELSFTYSKDTNEVVKHSKNKLLNKSGEKYYTNAINLEKNEFYISDIKLNEENSKIEYPNKPVIVFSTPIIDKNGERKGVFVSKVYAEQFIDLIVNTQNNLNDGMNYYLITRDGSYIYNKDESKRWAKQLNNNVNFDDDFKNVIKNKNKNVFILDDKIFSFSRMHPYSKYRDKYFYLVSKIDSHFALKDLGNFTTSFILIIVLIIFFSYLVITFYISKLTKPLLSVSNKLNSLSKGRIVDYDIEYKGKDEISKLIESSNILVESLTKSVNQVKRISNGDFSNDFVAQNKNDELGIAISNMTKRLNDIAVLAIKISQGNYKVEVDVKNDSDMLGHALSNMIIYLNDITTVIESISEGNLEFKHKVKNTEDKLGHAINSMSEYLIFVISYANSIAKDDFSLTINPKSKNDHLGENLLLMTNKLKTSYEKNKDEIWFSTGINEFTFNVKNFDNIKELCESTISNLVRYLNANSAMIYVYDNEEEILNHAASYAYNKNENFKKQIKIKEGVLGQVAFDKKELLLENLSNTQIQTSLVTRDINETFCIPIVYEDKTYAVIEISTIRKFSKLQKDFILKIADIFSEIFHRTMLNLKVKKLLEESQRSFEELQTNSEELQSTNDQMQEQADMLENQSKELKKSSKYKSDFLSNMSHELRTPLNSIILLSSLLKKNKAENLNEKDIQKANIINQSGNELLRLISDILDLSKIEAGKMLLIIDKIDSKEFLQINSEAFIFTARDKGIEFIIEDNFKGIFYTDSHKLSQIIRNLLSNALKFTKEGSITLKISNNDDKNLPIKIDVIDTGIGISKEKQELIFKAFVQVDGSTSREFGGTGLGLSITKELLALMGGKIYLESSEKEGSCFSLLLPSLEKEFVSNNEISKKNIIEVKEEIETKNISYKTSNYINLEKMKSVLVIEDDLVQQKAIGDYLKSSQKIKIEYSDSVTHSLKLLKEHTFDLIIADLSLSDGQGSEVCKYIKTKNIKVPVIIYTCKELEQDEIDFLSSISDEIIIKNYNSQERFNDEVNRFLNLSVNKTSKKTEKTESLSSYSNLRNKKVLIVDDDIKNIFVLSAALQEVEMQTVHAKNGKDALEILNSSNDIDIVLMDIMMPIMNGYEAIEQIRKNKKLEKLPVIAVTAKAMQEDKQKAINCGADDYLTKPIDLDKLISMVSMWLNKNC